MKWGGEGGRNNVYSNHKITSLKLNVKPLLTRLLTQPLEITESVKGKIAKCMEFGCCRFQILQSHPSMDLGICKSGVSNEDTAWVLKETSRQVTLR